MIRVSAVVVMLLAVAFMPLSCRSTGINVGSKKFTESVILGECVKLLAEDAETTTTHFRESTVQCYVYRFSVQARVRSIHKFGDGGHMSNDA